MATRNNSLPFRIALSVGIVFSAAGVTMCSAGAQAPAPAAAPAAASQLGTIKTISGNTLTMATDKGQTVTVSVATGAKVYQLPVGSTDLKTAKPAQLTDIAVGDRALVTGKAGDTPDTLTAVRVILMKSSDIAQMQEQQQADWKTRGAGGLVSTVDPATGTITITSGTTKVDNRYNEQDSVQAVCRRLGEVPGCEAGQDHGYPAEGPVAGAWREVRGRHLDAGRRGDQWFVREPLRSASDR